MLPQHFIIYHAPICLFPDGFSDLCSHTIILAFPMTFSGWAGQPVNVGLQHTDHTPSVRHIWEALPQPGYPRWGKRIMTFTPNFDLQMWLT